MMPLKFFKTARAFERWLAANHGEVDSLLVGFHKIGSEKRSISYSEALDAALAYGWIDGIRRRIDANSYTIRFTPRKKNSYWSAVNIKRAKDLMKQARMKPAGLAAFKERDEARARRFSDERRNAVLDAAALRALKADKQAYAYFQTLPPGMKRLYAFWVTSAKREQTRAQRLAIVIARCRAGKRIDPFHPFSRD
jgi:uncharacterized protein YdeI (YjbR/CyaY-like superfamily)